MRCVATRKQQHRGTVQSNRTSRRSLSLLGNDGWGPASDSELPAFSVHSNSRLQGLARAKTFMFEKEVVALLSTASERKEHSPFGDLGDLSDIWLDPTGRFY